MLLEIVTVDPGLGSGVSDLGIIAVWLLFAITCTAIVWFKGI